MNQGILAGVQSTDRETSVNIIRGKLFRGATV